MSGVRLQRFLSWKSTEILVYEIRKLQILNFVLGLSDEMRQNFSVMKDLAQHTRIAPSGRVEQLRDFMRSLNTNEQSQKELSQWNMAFSPNLLQMKGRTLPTQRKYLLAQKCGFAIDSFSKNVPSR